MASSSPLHKGLHESTNSNSTSKFTHVHCQVLIRNHQFLLPYKMQGHKSVSTELINTPFLEWQSSSKEAFEKQNKQTKKHEQVFVLGKLLTAPETFHCNVFSSSSLVCILLCCRLKFLFWSLQMQQVFFFPSASCNVFVFFFCILSLDAHSSSQPCKFSEQTAAAWSCPHPTCCHVILTDWNPQWEWNWMDVVHSACTVQHRC